MVRASLLRVIFLIVAISAVAYGLDPNRAPSEYVFEEWGPAQEFHWGAVHSLAQTPDGYLWIGCEMGLVRFNGVSFELMSGTGTKGVPAGPVQQLATDSDANLWIRERDTSLFRYKNGKAENVLRSLFHSDRGSTAMSMGRQGTVIFWTGSTGLWCCQGDALQSQYRDSALRHNLLVVALAETSRHRLWLGTRDAGLLSLENGKLVDFAAELPDLKVNAIIAEGEDRLWIGTDGGVIRWNGQKLTKQAVPGSLQKAEVVSLARDHEANVWVGTGHALYRVTAKGETRPVWPDRITGVNVIFEDREDNLWLGTDDGVARLRDSTFLSYPQPGERHHGQENSPLYVDEGGRTWYSTTGGTVNWRRGSDTGKLQIGKPDDTIYSIAGSGAEVWVGRKYGGLTLIRCNQSCRVVRSYTEEGGLVDSAITAVMPVADGSVWAGTANSGIVRLQNGKLTRFRSPSDLNSNSIRAMAQTNEGTLWFATSNGLSAEYKGRWRTYNASDGLPPGGIYCLSVDQENVLWIGAASGLAFLQAGQLHTVDGTSTFGEPVLGLAAGRSGWLWLATATHVLQIKRAAAIRGHIQSGEEREFNGRDGLLTGSILPRHPVTVMDSTGRVWVSTSRGLSVIDLTRLPAQSVPALPNIQAIVADGVQIKFAQEATIPPLRKRVQFDFVGLSLTSPQRIQYQYRLDNFDGDWSNPVAIHEAVYTNLTPGRYRFRLRARNAAGLWSSQEASITVQVEPAFWQTEWFQLIAVLALALCFAAAYRQRLRIVQQTLHVRFQERLAERTRIAQELHDTLLQGFLSASLQLHVASHRLEPTSLAKAPLQRATELMQKASDEGRAALRQLRAEEDRTALEDAFSTIPHEAMMGENIRFHMRVEGRTQALKPALHDDIYRIVREAIVNAIRHSGAKNIAVEVGYSAQQLCVTVQDDGHGIDPQVLQRGREGHWGLRGMRERAERIKAKLSLVSSSDEGTKIVLRVPGHLAYTFQQHKNGRQWLSRILRRHGQRQRVETREYE